jgi:hypothetical protein
MNISGQLGNETLPPTDRQPTSISTVHFHPTDHLCSQEAHLNLNLPGKSTWIDPTTAVCCPLSHWPSHPSSTWEWDILLRSSPPQRSCSIQPPRPSSPSSPQDCISSPTGDPMSTPSSAALLKLAAQAHHSFIVRQLCVQSARSRTPADPGRWQPPCDFRGAGTGSLAYLRALFNILISNFCWLDWVLLAVGLFRASLS